MKKYIILSGSVDGPTCEDDGFINCASFDLVGSRACDSLEEAIEVRDQTIEQDKADFAEVWPEEDGYTLDVGSISRTRSGDPSADKYIDIYSNGDVINETIYKIREIEC